MRSGVFTVCTLHTLHNSDRTTVWFYLRWPKPRETSAEHQHILWSPVLSFSASFHPVMWTCRPRASSQPVCDKQNNLERRTHCTPTVHRGWTGNCMNKTKARCSCPETRAECPPSALFIHLPTQRERPVIVSDRGGGDHPTPTERESGQGFFCPQE